MDEKLQSKLRQARALMDKAEHPNTPAPEAEACRAKADALIYTYKLDALMAAGVGHAAQSGIAPVWQTWEVCATTNEFRPQYRQLVGMILSHTDSMGAFTAVMGAEGMQTVANVVGLESDITFAELLFTSARAEFARRLEPRVDPNLSDRENAYVLRHAGLEGRRIAILLYGENTKALRSRVRRYFEEEAKKRGEDPRPLMGTNSVKVYRETYADAFTSELWSRLWRMRQERSAEAGALVLKDAKNLVEEEFYGRFPELRPKAAIAWTDPTKDCPKCQKAQSGYCREHSYLKPRKEKERQINMTAYDRGRDAARSVDLGPGARRRLDDDRRPPGELT